MGGRTQQVYQLIAHRPYIRVDQAHIELRLGRQLGLGGGEPPLDHLGRLGPPAGEPADQLLP